MSDGDHQNDVSITIDQVTSSDQTEKNMVAEGAVNSYDDNQHDISLTSNEMNGTDPTSDSLFPTEKETNTYEKAGNYICDANCKTSDEFSTEKDNGDITDGPNVQAYVKSGDNVLTKDIPVQVSNEITIVEVKYPGEEYLPGSSHEVDSNGDESHEEGDTHEVDDSDDESSEISSIENEDEDKNLHH